ncbi:hypothetical protein [Streptomyces sp. B27]|uniref:hypothetical protein n=1 Tax=Streptomyces sp. B27 TaxID=2485015 RepID=UPI0019D05C62|nr:hypothetical protein [Streptomyces sp. B27]
MLSLAFDVAQFRFDLGLRQSAVGCQFKQVLLACIERSQLRGELLMEEPSGSLLFTNGLGDVSADVGDEGRTEPHTGIVALDGILDVDDVDVRSPAGAVLPVAAEEVQVFGATSIDCALEDQALGDARLPTPLAEERSLEVVVVHPTTLTRNGAGFDDLLYAFEEVFADERLVTPLELIALVGDVADVVAVAQHV